MNAYTIIFILITTAAVLMLPRRWFLLPLLMGACYITQNQVMELGPFHFTIIRILVLAGILRIIMRRERLTGRINGLDWLILAWSVIALITSAFHEDPSAALIARLGLVYDICGIYFLVRVFCQSLDDIERLFRFIAILLIPIALEMIYEKLMVNNLFFALEGSSVELYIREGHVRSQGSFIHSILAGTVGAVCLPLIVPLWRQYRKLALLGIGACLAMIITSASSGPILSMMAAIAALFMYRYRYRMRLLRWLLVLGYITLAIIMNDPPYFLMARIDLAGGGTGYFRARLIQSAIEHISEWWLVGTDYTRHWMPTGVYWSPNHTDITNYYVQMGVWGGLSLMLLFMAMLAKGFSFVGQTLRQSDSLPSASRFMIWALGASLFAHAVTCTSVSYFDQSFLFLDLVLASICSVRSATVSQNRGEVATGKGSGAFLPSAQIEARS